MHTMGLKNWVPNPLLLLFSRHKLYSMERSRLLCRENNKYNLRDRESLSYVRTLTHSQLYILVNER